MRTGHFHLHVRPIYRSSGHSAVAAAAYQANDVFTHEKKNVGQLAIEHRRPLNKGIVTAELRGALAHSSIGIHLSEDATAVKEGRQYWTIHDQGQVYDVREFITRELDKETGKRKVTAQGLDVYAPRTYNYTKKRDAVQTWVQVPDAAPDWMQAMAAEGNGLASAQRQWLWNTVENTERRRDGRAAYTMQVALSRELSFEQNMEVLRGFVDRELTAHGRIADVAMHSIKALDGGVNLHAHIIYTARAVKADGTLADVKSRKWESKQQVHHWREAWAETLNQALKEHGHEVQVDPRSYARQGSDRQPEIRLGPEATAMERRGIASRRGNYNRKIREQVEKAVSLMTEDNFEYIQNRNPGQEFSDGDLGYLKHGLPFMNSGQPVPQAQRIYRSNEYGRVGPPPTTVQQYGTITPPIPHRTMAEINGQPSASEQSYQERGEFLADLTEEQVRQANLSTEDYINRAMTLRDRNRDAHMAAVNSGGLNQDNPDNGSLSGQQEIAEIYGSGVGPAAEATVEMGRHATSQNDAPDQAENQIAELGNQMLESGQLSWVERIERERQQPQPQDPGRMQEQQEQTASFTELARQHNPGIDHQAQEQQRGREKDRDMER